MNAEAIQDCLDRNDAAAAIQVMAKIRFSDLKSVGYRFGMGTGYNLTKKQYMERAQSVIPMLTNHALERARYAARLRTLASRFDQVRHHREMCAGALAMGGYNESLRDEQGIAACEAEMLALAAEFAEESRAAGVPDEIRVRCAHIMAIA